MSSSETYGQMVARLRKERGWTQADLAAASGVSKRTLQDIEGDKHGRPHRANRLALNKALGIEGEPQSERQSWPEDVQVFLDIMGAWLATLDEEARLEKVSQLVREIVSGKAPKV